MQILSKNLLQNNKYHPYELYCGLEKHDLSITSEVELKEEIIYTPAEGVARGKVTMRNNESLIVSLEVFRDH